MRLVHLSDLHLGFRQFQRMTPGGINQREADVAKSFTHAVDRIVALRPDIVLVAGDVFHTVRPTNPAILHAFTQFARLAQALPDAIIVIVAGNHDLPRSSESTCILALFEQIGIHVAHREPRQLHFPEHDLTILAMPEIDDQLIEWKPDPVARHNILVVHAEAEGMYPEDHAPDEPARLKVPRAVLESESWSYIALGHQHVYERAGPKAFYSGSLDHCSSSIWPELSRQKSQKLPGKGFIERDLETGKQTFHPLQPVVREFIDLPPIEGRGLAAADLDAAIAAAVERIPGGVEGKVVRLVTHDVPRHVVRELNHKALRELQRKALHFHLDTRRPEVIRTEGSGAPGRRPSLADTLRESLRSRVLTGDIDRERLIELGLKYLGDAEAIDAQRGAVATVDDS